MGSVGRGEVLRFGLFKDFNLFSLSLSHSPFPGIDPVKQESLLSHMLGTRSCNGHQATYSVLKFSSNIFLQSSKENITFEGKRTEKGKLFPDSRLQRHKADHFWSMRTETAKKKCFQTGRKTTTMKIKLIKT